MRPLAEARTGGKAERLKAEKGALARDPGPDTESRARKLETDFFINHWLFHLASARPY